MDMNQEIRKINTLLAEANTARREDRFEDAKQKIASALKVVRPLFHTELLTKSLNDLARIERDLGNTSSSIATYEELIQLHEKHGNTLGIAHALRHLGDIHRDEEKIDLADDYYTRALDIYKSSEHRSQVDLANAIRGYALLQEQKGKLKDALKLWKEARMLYENNSIYSGVEECSQRIDKLA